jgi:hypothetical protein
VDGERLHAEKINRKGTQRTQSFCKWIWFREELKLNSSTHQAQMN